MRTKEIKIWDSAGFGSMRMVRDPNFTGRFELRVDMDPFMGHEAETTSFGFTAESLKALRSACDEMLKQEFVSN